MFYSPTDRTGQRHDERCQRQSAAAAPQTPQRWQVSDIHSTYIPRAPRSGQPNADGSDEVVSREGRRRRRGGLSSAHHHVRTPLMIRNIPGRWRAQDLDRLLGRLLVPARRLQPRQCRRLHPRQLFVRTLYSSSTVCFGPGAKMPCCISYADIQGYECLVTKFRNSSIMQKVESLRPMLWYTTEIRSPKADARSRSSLSDSRRSMKGKPIS